MAMSLGYTAVITLIAMTAGASLVQLFGFDDAKIIGLASTYLHSTSMFYWTLSLLFILRYTLQGVGQSVVPTIAGIMELVMRAVGCAALAVPFGFSGICIAYALAWPGSLCPLAISYVFTMRRMRKNMEISKRTEI